MMKIIEKKKIWILAIIVVIAALLRFYELGKVPISPNWDETALAYNAYSLLTTGKDEYGRAFPVVLQSFNDYKPALYTYLTIPSVALFGVNAYAARFPAAFFGVIAIVVAYVLTKEILKRTDIALLTALFLAISPWHIQFSRTAFESNIGVLVNMLMALFFLKSFKKPWLLVLSAFFAGLNLYVYQSEKVFTPLLLLLLALIYKKDLWALPKKVLVVSILTGIAVVLPMAWYIITTPESLVRIKGTSPFANSQDFLRENAARIASDHARNDYLGLLVDNRRIEYAKTVVSNYLWHFDLKWLFMHGDFVPQHNPPQMGNMYLWSLPFLLLGLYNLIFGRFNKKGKLLILGWILITPIPASMTFDVPNAVRTLNFLPILQIGVAVGIVSAVILLKNLLKYKIVIAGAYGVILLGLFLNIAYYLDQYFVQYNQFLSHEWQYGYAQAVPKVKELEKKYEKVIVDNRKPMDQSYMFFLFYLQFPPSEYHKHLSFNASGQFEEYHTFGKYEFRPVYTDDVVRNPNVLYVGRPDELNERVNIIETLYYKDGTSAMVIAEGGEKER